MVILFSAVFILLGLYVVWCVPYLAFLDHPSHLFREKVLAEYHNPNLGFDKYFIRNLGLVPNQASDLLVYILGLVFPISTASKIFYSLYILILPGVGLLFLRTFRKENMPYAIVFSALTFNHFVIMGNENFFFSLPFFLLFASLWRGGRNFSPAVYYGLLALLATLLYYCHMVGFAAALLLVLTVGIAERRKIRDMALDLVVFVPGMLLFIIWTFVKIKMQGPSFHFELFSSLGEKFHSLSSGASPGLLQLSPAAFAWLYYLGMLFMIVLSIVSKKSEGVKKLALALFGLFLLCILLPRWFIIFEPGQRFLILGLFLFTAWFPSNIRIQFGFCVVLIYFTFFLRVKEIQYVKSTNRIVEHVIEPFEELPSEVRSRDQVILPLILHPFAEYPAFHKSFEYYNILHGGMNPHHLASVNHTVRYRKKPPAPDIYRPWEVKKETIGYYDIVLIIGKEGEGGARLMEYLLSRGFEEAAKNEVTGVFVRKDIESVP